MKRCRHLRVVELWVARRDERGETPTEMIVGWCPRCGKRGLPLGPATITPDVEVEIRAARLADGSFGPCLAARHVDDDDATGPYEHYGWIAFANTPTDAYGLRGDELGFAAGWLARQIATHEDAS